ncbi:MAG: hypothetical protein GXZ08_05485 [Tissierellia bacterium]|nr:hypothetical protein [Tissierellia bacterium]
MNENNKTDDNIEIRRLYFHLYRLKLVDKYGKMREEVKAKVNKKTGEVTLFIDIEDDDE